jgi:hypothetical protein
MCSLSLLFFLCYKTVFVNTDTNFLLRFELYETHENQNKISQAMYVRFQVLTAASMKMTCLLGCCAV